jgi:hypothetical protein
MMGWEEPLMKEHVRLMCDAHPKTKAGEGLNILNIGYGLGIVGPTPINPSKIHSLHPSDRRHVSRTHTPTHLAYRD